VLGTLRASVAAETRLPAATPVIAPAAHDTASAVAATAGLDEGAFISSGTWSLVGAEVAEPVLSARALERDFTNEGGVGGTIRLLKNVAGLWLLEACKRQWEREGAALSWPALLEAAAAAPPFRSFVDPGAETFLNPDGMPEAIRGFCRRSGQPEPESVGEIVRCCLESLALKYRTVLDDLEALTGRRFRVVRIVGGGSQNALLNQFTADACARPVVAGPVEATALGNLTVQAVACGLLPDLEAGRKAVAASAELRTFEPKHTDAWEAALARFTSLSSTSP
jgi:rhamnulokinase